MFPLITLAVGRQLSKQQTSCWREAAAAAAAVAVAVAEVAEVAVAEAEAVAVAVAVAVVVVEWTGGKYVWWQLVSI